MSRLALLVLVFVLSALATVGCDSAVAWCVAEGGSPEACAEQWGAPACEPVVQPDGFTCCAPGTGGEAQPQCDR